ncbi:MAG TPA: ThiF family adenylyltransferase [Patescibacteria group bacterium]|nr:ThiF family adenylyltransferase [Patescibacteria group bacterium]
MAVAIEESRNLGFWTEAEQQALGSSVVVVAGAGGDGGMLAEELVRMGVGCGEGGEIRLADPEVFDRENLNRQAASNITTVGQNKARAVATALRLIRPEANISVFTDGVTHDNIDQLLDGADLLIDETEFTTHAIGVALARAARKRSIANLQVLNVGFGAQITSYDAEGKFTLEDRLGLSNDASLQDIAAAEVSIDRWLASIPPYASMQAFKKVAAGEKSAPSVAPGVAIAAGFGAVQAFLHLVGPGNNRPKPVYAPHTLSVDAMTGQSKLIKHPRIHFLMSYAKMAWKNRRNLTPDTDY